MLGSVQLYKLYKYNCYKKKGKLPPFFRVYVQELATWLKKKDSPQEDEISIFLLISLRLLGIQGSQKLPPSLSFNQGPACGRPKAHMQIGMAPAGAGPKYLSCQLQLETCLACAVKVLDILFT